MKVVEIRQESKFRELKPAWDGLLRESNAGVFLSWEWATAWWSVYGRSGDLRILAASDESGVLRGIAPLRARTLCRFGYTVPTLSFIGDGSNDSDYLDFILARGYEEPVMQAFWSRLSNDMKSGTVLELNEIPEHSTSLPLLTRLAGETRALWTSKDIPCGTVHLPETWDIFLVVLRSRFRTKVRSVLRQLESRGEVTFGFADAPEQSAELLPVLFDLHARRWAKEGKPGVFGTEQKRDFYRAVSPLFLAPDWLRLSWMKWNGRVLACQYGFVYNKTYFQLQEGYEPDADHLNAGIGLRAWSIRKLMQQGVREYDFLSGVKRNKTDWGAQIKQSKQILIGADSWKNRFVCRGPVWLECTRESISRLLPEKLHALRKSWRSPASTISTRDRLMKAAAACYFYSRLPRLIRPLRERYQLSRVGSAAKGGLTLQKRAQPAGRILYYHRINDERDPFFPAISTELFEKEMRYVARHYHVVSISELLDRLQSGAPGLSVAITFDDGYEDNYSNAYPILQKYGLPATIFLSTGSLDSREPLWFEELAGALKKTEREYVDLEIEFPRRFYLRTQEERLESNWQMFALLRRMEDGQRREWLGQVLRQAQVGGGERRNKMLTWDQVRAMKEQRIDFGGHTVTHPFISRLTRDQVAWEVSECKRRIEAELQHPVDHFAYPNGREEDFGKWNKDVLRDAGYKSAMTTIWGMNYASTDRMELRRGGPWEESEAMFAYKLDWYQWVNG